MSKGRRAIGWEPPKAKTAIPTRINTGPREKADTPVTDSCPYPWRYRIDQWVHVWGFNQEFSFRIVGGELMGKWAWPHYRVISPEGEEWTVPQMHLSTRSLERSR